MMTQMTLMAKKTNHIHQEELRYAITCKKEIHVHLREKLYTITNLP